MDVDLEQLIDERLKRLPEPRAPHTLQLRVMAAIAQPGPAARPWFAWPRAWQAAFVGAWMLGAAAMALGLSSFTKVPGWTTPMWLDGAVARAIGAARDVEATFDAARIFVGVIVSQPVVLCLAALVIVMTAACVMCGAMLGRVMNVRVQGAD